MRFIRIAALSIVLLAAAMPASAQWTNVAPNLFNRKDYGGVMTYSSGKLWCAYANKIWISEDDGLTWSDRTPKDGITTPRDIDFFDANNGFLATDRYIYITQDGGNNWRQILNPIQDYISAKFIASENEIIVSSIFSDVAITRDGGATWNVIHFPRYCPNDVETRRSGVIYVMLTLNSGGASNNDSSRIITSSDYGTTWTYSKTGFDYDCLSFALDPCNDKRYYVVNEELYVQTDKKPSIYVSSDGGGSWQITTTSNEPYLCGSIRTSQAGIIFAQTVSGGIIRSIDKGMTWKNIGGPAGLIDSRTLACKDDNTIFAMDTNGSIWRTTNGGGSPITIPNNALIISPNSLFDNREASLCDSITDKITITSTGCNPPTVKDYTITGSAAGDYAVGFRDQDSIIVRFHPSQIGSRPATLVITLTNGTTLNVTLGGSGIIGGGLTAYPKILFDGEFVSLCDSLDGTVTLKSTGCAPPYVKSYVIDGLDPLDYSVVFIDKDSIIVRCRPSALGLRNAELVLTLSNDSLLRIPLFTVGQNKVTQLTAIPKTLFDSDTVALCSTLTRGARINSKSCNKLDIISQNITGISASDYSLITFAPTTLTGSDSITITFAPSTTGLRQAYYDLLLADSTTLQIPLLGTGRDTGYLLAAVSAAPFTSDSCALCQTLTRKFRVHSGGCVVPRVSSQSISGSAMKNYSLDASVPDPLTGDDEVTITFTPNATGTANADYTLTMADGRKLIVPLAARGYKIPYTLTFTPKDLFSRDSLYVLCGNSSGSGSVTISGCPLPKVASESIIGGAANDYLLKTKAADSLIAPYTFDITFTPSAIGNRDAEYKLLFDDGSSVSVPLLGYGLKSVPLMLDVPPAFHTDTIGGLISVPIIIKGLDKPRDVELTIHFDNGLVYTNTSLGAKTFDVAGTLTNTSVRIFISAADINLGAVSAYANFTVFPDPLSSWNISFDSISVPGLQCQSITNSYSATITGLKGCGIGTLTRYVRTGRIELGSIIPNPTRGGIDVTFSLPADDGVTFELVDSRGIILRSLANAPMTKGMHTLHFDLGGESAGNYFVKMVTGSGEEISQKCIISK